MSIAGRIMERDRDTANSAHNITIYNSKDAPSVISPDPAGDLISQGRGLLGSKGNPDVIFGETGQTAVEPLK